MNVYHGLDLIQTIRLDAIGQRRRIVTVVENERLSGHELGDGLPLGNHSCYVGPDAKHEPHLSNAMHITASVFINDDEPGLHHDYGLWLEQIAPFNASPQKYHHNRTREDNADPYMKRQMMGREVVVAITKGKLDFGPW